MGKEGPGRPPHPQAAGVGRAAVRRLVAQLPEAREGAHHGHPDFRVRNRIFATLGPAEDRAALHLPYLQARALAAAAPDTYALVADREPFAWVSVRLGQVALADLRDLLEQAWRWRAPAAVVARYEAPDAADAHSPA